MQTNKKMNFENLIPEAILFSLTEVEDLKILKVSMAKKLIRNGQLEHVKVGVKIFICRKELIRYLRENTIPREGETHE